MIDTNIFIHVLLDRELLAETSAQVLSLSENRRFDGFVTASCITDIFYIIKKTLRDAEVTKQIMQNLLKTVFVAGVDETCIRRALDSDWSDFEDSVQHEVAQQIRADFIITRNQTNVRINYIINFINIHKYFGLNFYMINISI